MTDRTKNAADLFSLVPRRQLVDIFSEWLEMEDFICFDSAVCNSVVRKLFLDLVQSDRFVFRGSVVNFIILSFFDWSIKRRIKVTDFTIYADIVEDDKLRHKYLTTTGRTLELIEFLDLGDGEAENCDVSSLQKVFYEIAEWCPNLTHLIMDGNVLDGSFCLPLIRCTRLQKLDVSKCSGVSQIILRSICALPNLVELVLSGTRFLPDAFDYPHTSSLSLKLLRLQHCDLSADKKATLVCLFPNLTDFSTTKLDGPSFLRIVKACPYMQVASLTVSGALSDATASMIATTWCHITYLYITTDAREADAVFSETAMLAIIVQCKALARMFLCTARSLLFRIETEPCNPTKSALRTLLCRSITAPTLAAIISQCPNFNLLGILRPTVTAGTAVVATSYPLDLLKGSAVSSLLLEYCTLSPSSLDTVENMKQIVFDACSGITDVALISLAQRCPGLERLTIKNCPQLTVDALIGTVTHCLELRSLTFLTLGNDEKQCPRTPQHKLIDTLVKLRCPHLVSISIN